MTIKQEQDLRQYEQRLIRDLRAVGVKDPLATALRLHGKKTKLEAARARRAAELEAMDRAMGILPQRAAVRHEGSGLVFDACVATPDRGAR